MWSCRRSAAVWESDNSEYVVTLACAFMGNVNPSCMQAFRVKWDEVCGQQRTALGSFVLIFILFPVSVTGYMPSIVHHLTLILYKIKNSSTRMDHTQCSPFNFPNEITEETPPSGPCHLWVDSNLLYCSLRMKQHFTLIHFPAPPFHPGDQCGLICLPLGLKMLTVCVCVCA